MSDVKTFVETLKGLENEHLNAIIIHPEQYEELMRFQEPTKWKLFLDGFHNFWYAWDSYETIEHFPDDFWEDINIGWLNMRDEYLMSQPNFDPYNLSGRDPYYSYIMRKK